MGKYLTALEKIMKENGSTGFYVGKVMTIADIAMWRMLGWLKGGIVDGLPTTLIDPYPLILDNWNSTDQHPQISAWMSEHYNKQSINESVIKHSIFLMQNSSTVLACSL